MNYFTSSTNKDFKEEFKTYGEEKYKIEIIKEFTNPKKCVRAENYIIRNHMLLKDGLCLNRACCCSGEKIFSTVGTHPSEETRKKMRIAKKGFHNSEETRKKISRALKGQSPSEDSRKKMSEAHKGQSPWNKGIPHSDKTRKKISEVLQGRPATNKIKISIEGMVFDSRKEAAKYYNVVPSTIRYWVKKNQHNAVYIEK